MSSGKTGNEGKPGRDDRLAERLRENLRKRKQQARSRATAAGEEKSDPSGEKD